MSYQIERVSKYERKSAAVKTDVPGIVITYFQWCENLRSRMENETGFKYKIIRHPVRRNKIALFRTTIKLNKTERKVLCLQ